MPNRFWRLKWFLKSGWIFFRNNRSSILFVFNFILFALANCAQSVYQHFKFQNSIHIPIIDNHILLCIRRISFYTYYFLIFFSYRTYLYIWLKKILTRTSLRYSILYFPYHSWWRVKTCLEFGFRQGEAHTKWNNFYFLVQWFYNKDVATRKV